MPESVKIVKVPKKDNLYKVTMIITKGKILAMVNALKGHPHSSVGKDLLDMIQAEFFDE